MRCDPEHSLHAVAGAAQGHKKHLIDRRADADIRVDPVRPLQELGLPALQGRGAGRQVAGDDVGEAARRPAGDGQQADVLVALSALAGFEKVDAAGRRTCGGARHGYRDTGRIRRRSSDGIGELPYAL